MSNTYAVFMEEIFDPKPFPFMTEPVTKSLISVLFFFFFYFLNIYFTTRKQKRDFLYDANPWHTQVNLWELLNKDYSQNHIHKNFLKY